MILVPVLLATAVSIGGLVYLASGDRKRRSAFRLSPPERPRPAWGWTAVLAPGLLAVALGGAGALFIWFGAASIAGWAISAMPPGRTAELLRGRVGWQRRFRIGEVRRRPHF